MCAAQCGRQLMSSPDVRITKSERALGVLEDKRFTKEGAEFREHGLRRCAPPPWPALSGNALRVCWPAFCAQLPAYADPHDLRQPQREALWCATGAAGVVVRG